MFNKQTLKDSILILFCGGLLGIIIGKYAESTIFHKPLHDSKAYDCSWNDDQIYGGKMLVSPFIDHSTGKEYIILTTQYGIAVIPKEFK